MPQKPFAFGECSHRGTCSRVSSEGAQVGEREPGLGTRFSEALYLPGEARVDNRALLKAVALALKEAGVECHWETFVDDSTPVDAGIVVDCRGMGAKGDCQSFGAFAARSCACMRQRSN